MGAELRDHRRPPPGLARVQADVQRTVDAGEVRLSESSPSATRFRRAGRGRVEVITFKPLSKNPGALHLTIIPVIRVTDPSSTSIGQKNSSVLSAVITCCCRFEEVHLGFVSRKANAIAALSASISCRDGNAPSIKPWRWQRRLGRSIGCPRPSTNFARNALACVLIQIRPTFFEGCKRAELPIAKFYGLIHIQVRAKR